MSSYLASFKSSSSISNVLGSRLNSLRRAISLGDEGDDPDNEDCSHISNALRAYYTEKGRPFPAWLPPDPKAPAPAASRPIVTVSGQHAQGAPGGAYGRSGGGLGDLWGDSNASSPGSTQTASLRRGRGSGASGASGSMVTPQSASPASVMSPTSQSLQANSPSSGARPLPSQRSGSYQSSRSSQDSRSGAGSAQERLRARLQGGRSPSPGNLDPSVRKPVGGRQW
ncbi:hypothetical protein POX_f07667 [Penicillium oxalicum]|uniref:Mso1 N-terminal domain-containing protein n=1 Tax=Penicillium oxalicum (strain 114-2 / CGMCC 5302) TaxID=933388 RepID=S8B2D8_PENO1|nr:hypothetical protein POX_f07667 [Penicillium oxalicum]EPS28587.1 hypothetical protein PDE_03533 [Penicillium oxalicum 114-2]KAI2787304.1 hypothetical protein POX_f07667 [Penicillium oxalicum]